VLCLVPAATHAGSALPVSTPDAVTTSPVIVIGFVGGFVKHDAMAHSAVQVAAHLRQDYPSGVYTEVLENRRRGKAHAEIVRFADTDRDGTLSVEEKQNARIIHNLSGHKTLQSFHTSFPRAFRRRDDREQALPDIRDGIDL